MFGGGGGQGFATWLGGIAIGRATGSESDDNLSTAGSLSQCSTRSRLSCQIPFTYQHVTSKYVRSSEQALGPFRLFDNDDETEDGLLVTTFLNQYRNTIPSIPNPSPSTATFLSTLPSASQLTTSFSSPALGMRISAHSRIPCP